MEDYDRDLLQIDERFDEFNINDQEDNNINNDDEEKKKEKENDKPTTTKNEENIYFNEDDDDDDDDDNITITIKQPEINESDIAMQLTKMVSIKKNSYLF